MAIIKQTNKTPNTETPRSDDFPREFYQKLLKN